jgi:hypothetical protein
LWRHGAFSVNTKENVMSPKGNMFIALAVAALAVPAVASAQQAYGQPQDPQPQPGYTQPGAGSQGYNQDQGPGPNDQQMQHGSKKGKHTQTSVYPQFRSLEKHIKHSVHEQKKANTLAKRDAHHFMAQLHQIQAEEMSAYNAHGLNLPADAQARIQGELTQLAQAVDQGQGQAPQRQGQPYRGQQ